MSGEGRMTKRIFMIAGPNGAGKTTTAMSFISSEMIDEFLNADEIARGLAPLHPESMSLTASKLMLIRLKELLNANKNFAFETTVQEQIISNILRKPKQKTMKFISCFYGFLVQL